MRLPLIDQKETREPVEDRRYGVDLGVTGADDISAAELRGEANHEAAEGLIAVEAPIVGADALEGLSMAGRGCGVGRRRDPRASSSHDPGKRNREIGVAAVKVEEQRLLLLPKSPACC